MLIQTSRTPHYARGVLGKPSDIDRIARQHIAIFWRGPVVEGRASEQGHLIDPDEDLDPLEAADSADQYDPEAQGGRMAAQLGEFLVGEEATESPCVTCPSLWCSGALEADCRGEGGAWVPVVISG